MKNVLIALCLLLGVMLFSRCTSEEKELQFSPPVFQDTIYPEVKVLNDTFMMGSAFDLNYYKDYLLVNTYINGVYLHLFDKNTGKHIKSVLSEGRGKGEVLGIREIDVDQQTGEVLWYDVMARKMQYFNIDTLVENYYAANYIYQKNPNYYVHKLLKGTSALIGIGESSKKNGTNRYVIIKSDTVASRYNSYPVVKTPTKAGIEAAYSYASIVSLSKEKDKMVCVSGYGAIIEIFDISSAEISLSAIKPYIRPEFEINKYGAPVAIKGKTVWGFSDVYTTSDNIYTIFLGHTDVKKINKIAVFDWEGKCERLYQVAGYNLERICVDQSQNRLYAQALNTDGESSLIYFDL